MHQIKQFVEAQALRYPIVLSSRGGDEFKLVMDSSELAACNGNAQTLILKLREKGVLGRMGFSSL